jgi:hypothetical protein
MGWLAGLLTVLVLLLPAPGAARAQATEPTDPLSVVRAFHAAKSAHDVEGVLAVLTDNAELDDCDCPTKETKRAAHVAAFARNSWHEYANYRVSGSTVTYTWRNGFDDFGRLPNVPPREGTGEATVRDGKIIRVTGVTDPASIERQNAALAANRAGQAASTVATVVARATVTEALAVQSTQVAASGVLQRTPDTQDRTTPSVAPWALALALMFVGTVALALFQRPSRAH